MRRPKFSDFAHTWHIHVFASLIILFSLYLAVSVGAPILRLVAAFVIFGTILIAGTLHVRVMRGIDMIQAIREVLGAGWWNTYLRENKYLLEAEQALQKHIDAMGFTGACEKFYQQAGITIAVLLEDILSRNSRQKDRFDTILEHPGLEGRITWDVLKHYRPPVIESRPTLTLIA